jgi:response regulator RpfG family c-di-GMP phosphodiesterase
MGRGIRSRILVVDADPAVRRLLAQVLSDGGRVPETVAGSAAAAKAVGRGDIAAALVDVSSAHIGGQLAADLMAKCADIAVIAMAPAEAVPTAIECVRLGASDYVTKPLDMQEVTLRVDRALERRQLIIEQRRHQEQLQAATRRESRNARRVLLGAINSLSSALEAKDDYTRGHSERVSLIAVEIANAVGGGSEDLRRVRLAGRLHDIGKIGVQESVLLKPGRLTDDEYRQVKAHPITGERILAPVLPDAAAVRIVRHHHEHYSGGGYPDGLRGSAIPLGARVLAVADAFDALTSDRPYRARLLSEDALGVLRAGAGEQWQPTLVEALAQRLEAIWPIVWRSKDREGDDGGEPLTSHGPLGQPDRRSGERS